MRVVRPKHIHSGDGFERKAYGFTKPRATDLSATRRSAHASNMGSMERAYMRSQEERGEGKGNNRLVEEAVLKVSADSSRQMARSANRTMISDDQNLAQKHRFRVASQSQGIQNALFSGEMRDRLQVQQLNRETDTELISIRKQRAKPFANEVEDREDPAPPPEKRLMTLNTWTSPAARETPILPPRSVIVEEISDVIGQKRRITGEPYVQVRMEEAKPALSFVGNSRVFSYIYIYENSRGHS